MRKNNLPQIGSTLLPGGQIVALALLATGMMLTFPAGTSGDNWRGRPPGAQYGKVRASVSICSLLRAEVDSSIANGDQAPNLAKEIRGDRSLGNKTNWVNVRRANRCGFAEAGGSSVVQPNEVSPVTHQSLAGQPLNSGPELKAYNGKFE